MESVTLLHSMFFRYFSTALLLNELWVRGNAVNLQWRTLINWLRKHRYESSYIILVFAILSPVGNPDINRPLEDPVGVQCLPALRSMNVTLYKPFLNLILAWTLGGSSRTSVISSSENIEDSNWDKFFPCCRILEVYIMGSIGFSWDFFLKSALLQKYLIHCNIYCG